MSATLADHPALRPNAPDVLWRRALGTAFRKTPAADARPMTFREFVERVNPRFVWYEHCVRLAAVLQRVADGELRRVIVAAPPRHGKSEMLSRLFSAYYLYRYPERWVGLTSYAADLAYTLSRAARDNFTRGGGEMRDDAAAVKHWETTGGGGLWAAGFGGPATGKGFHLGIIDDPIKNAEEAASEVIGARNRDWYRSVFSTRGEPGEAIVVMQTRWPGPGDLVGFLLSEESEDEEPERWHVVIFEALKEDDDLPLPATCTREPDWRVPGEALCPERYSVAKLRTLAKRIGSFFFAALFQQRPRGRQGDLFKIEWFDIVDVAPAQGTRVRYWDTAGTDQAGKGDPDYTAGVLMQRRPDGVFVVLDVVRGQWSVGKRDLRIAETAHADAARYGAGGVTVWIEREAGIGGRDRTQALVRALAGHTVHTEPATGSKMVRAEPLVGQAEQRNVQLLRGAWNAAFLGELTDFPKGSHDDQVDAASGAFNKLAGAPVPFAQPDPNPRRFARVGYRS